MLWYQLEDGVCGGEVKRWCQAAKYNGDSEGPARPLLVFINTAKTGRAATTRGEGELRKERLRGATFCFDSCSLRRLRR